MSEAIDEFLVDFYKTKNNEDISVDKIQEIKKAYGSDTDSLITDLYTKYDDGNIDKEKITTIKSTYKLTPEKKEKTPEYTIDVDEETATGIGKYSDRLSKIAQFKLPEDKIALLKQKFDKNLSEGGDDSKRYMDQALESLKATNKALVDADQKPIPITDETQQAEALKLYTKNIESKLITKRTDEIMEEFETDFGIDRTKSWGAFVDNMMHQSPMVQGHVIKMLRQEAKDKGLTEDQWDLFYKQAITNNSQMGGDALKYFEARQELNRQVGVKQKEIEEPYAEAVSDITAERKDIDAIANKIKEFEKKAKAKDPSLTADDWANYKKLYDNLEVKTNAINKHIEELGNMPVPSDNFNTIKDLTLKTYDNLSMVENNVASSAISVVAGIGQLGHELSMPVLMEKWGGYELNDVNKQMVDNSEGVLKSLFELSNEIKGENAPVPTIGEVDSLSDFGMYMMDLASGQIVNTALTVALPPAGLAIMAASAAGGKMHDMNIEMEGQKWSPEELALMKEQGITPDSEYKVEPKELNPAQYFGTAAMYGGVEYLTEKVSLGILKGGFKNVQKAFDLAGKTGVNKTLKNLTKPQQLAKLGYNFGKDSFKEAGAEGIVQLTNNFADMVVLGNKDVSLLDGMTDAMAAGFFMGNMFAGPPAIAAGVTTAFSSEAEFAKANKLNAQLIQLSEQRDKILEQDPTDVNGAASRIQAQIETTLDTQMESMNQVKQRTLDMTATDRQGMIDQYNREHYLRKEIDDINENPDYTTEIKEIMINDRAQEIAESEAIRSRLIGDATFNADIKRQADLAQTIRAENGTLDIVETVVAENADGALEQGLEKIDAMDLNDQQKSQLKKNLTNEFNAMKKKSQSGESYHGFAWGDNIEIETQKDGVMVKETLNVPMTFALNKNNATVQSHELGHHTLFKQFMKNNPDAVGLVEDLEGYVKKNYKQAYEQFNKVRRGYKSEGLTKEQMAEEQLAHLSDFMRQNNLKGDRTLHNKLFGRFQKVNDGQNQIETGKDVFDMLNSYNQSFETGQLQGLAKSVIKGEAAIKRKKQEARDVKSKEQGQKLQTDLKAPKAKMSKFVEGETKSERSKRQNKRNVDVAKIYKADAVGKTNEQWRDFLDSPKGKSVMGDMIQQYYPDMIASAIKRKADSPMDAASEAIIPLMKHIEAFDPSQNKDLAGYVGGYLGLKVGTGVKKAAKKAPTISMEKEGVRQVAEKQAQPTETTSKDKVIPKYFIKDRLGDKAKAIHEKVKAMAPKLNLKGKGYKQTPKLALKETIGMFMTDPNAKYVDDGTPYWKTKKGKEILGTSILDSILDKVEKNAALNNQDIKAVQQFLNTHADTLIAGALAEGTDPSGKSTGMAKVLLDAFYTKGKSVKFKETGSKQGLAKQTKKKNIEKAAYNKMFGITEAGKPNIQSVAQSSQPIKAMLRATEKIITNQALREAGAPAKMGEGKSRVMYSKDLDAEIKRIKDNNAKEKKSGTAVLDALVDAEALATLRTNPSVLAKAINELGVLAGKKLGTFGIDKFLMPGGFTSGSKVSSLDRLGFKVISDINNIKDPKLRKEAQQRIDEGSLIDLKSIRDKVKNKYESLSKEDIKAFQIATGAKSGAGAKKHAKNRDLHNKGVKQALDVLLDTFLLNKQGEALVRELLHHGKLNKNLNRNFAIPVSVEVGATVDGKRRSETTDEHQFQAIENAEMLLELFKNIKESKEGKAKDTAKEALELYKKWMEKNYTQFLLKNESDIIKGDLVNKKGEVWSKSGSNSHPKIKEKLKKFLEISRKKDATVEDIKKAFNEIPSADLRYFSDFGYLNPNTIKTYQADGSTITKAEEYNVVVPKQYQLNPDVTLAQGKIIEKVILTEAGILTGNQAVTRAEAKARMKVALPIAIEQSKRATPANEKVINNSGVMLSKSLNNEETIRQAEIMDKALNIARDPLAPVKKIRVFDFDDTLARTKSKVKYTMPDGKSGVMSAADFAKRGTELMEQGAEFDFSDFNKVVDGKKGPLFKVAEMIAEKRGTKDMFVLTARSADAAPAIKEFLDALGLNIPIENITGLADSSPLAKSGWMVNKAAEGYNDFYFADDATKNVKAVQKVMDVIDVKSKVQQAKVKFSKNIDQTFNDIIEEKTGIGSEKEYSAAKAKTVGSSKGKFKFWIAPSAEDFVGLLYTMLGKGKLGDTQMAWFKKHLLDPYGRAMENISREQTRLSNDFKALKKALVKSGTLPKNLNKKAVGNWTYQDVSRIVAWNKQGLEVPGLSKADLKEILDFANENPGINEFADQLIAINKGDGYIQPGKDWYAGTITTDLLQGLREGKRAKYLQEWQANADLIFSEKNLNKLEAAFGPKYREAMEDMLRRMRTGKNRTSTGNRLENRLLDYVNNSVGTVMFLNMRSGVLQLISAANFLNWKSNNILAAGRAFANQKQYWSDFMRLMNSDFLVDRRNGLKINVSESEIADAARDSSNKARSVISYLLKKGFTVTQIMDSFAIASGGSTFYRNRIKELTKQGYSKADAEAQAYQEFRELAEESQQSSRPDRISQQQASNLGRIILAFANTPMQYNRIMKKAFLDLKNQRGDWKSNISKIVYYGAIQNAIFVGMQQALFALAFDDEEETDEVKKKKYYSMANSMMDNILRGLGMFGAGASALINVVRKVREQSEKEGSWPPPDYDEAAWEFLNFSPPIDIKMSKLRQAANNWKYEGWKHDEAKWGIEDPAYESAASVISALTNIPVDRFYRKMENIQSALDSDQETWKRIANLFGWSSWQLESTKEREQRKKEEKGRKKDIKKEKVEQAQVEKVKQMTPQEKKKHEEEKKRKKYKDLNKDEQVHKLDSLGLTKKEIRALKYEKDRVEKLLELMENED
jgi:hypothetical protein